VGGRFAKPDGPISVPQEQPSWMFLTRPVIEMSKLRLPMNNASLVSDLSPHPPATTTILRQPIVNRGSVETERLADNFRALPCLNRYDRSSPHVFENVVT
jgi:hypothetical protein